MLLSGSEKQVMVEQNVEITRYLWLTVNETKVESLGSSLLKTPSSNHWAEPEGKSQVSVQIWQSVGKPGMGKARVP